MASIRTRTILGTLAAVTATLLLLGSAGAYIVWRGGWYDIRATTPHWQVVYDVLEGGMRYSVQRRADSVPVPPLQASERIAQGAAVFRDKCVQCHGAPGVSPHDLGKSMQPVPGPLVDAARRWRPSDLYVITRHGIKMSGMPAWQFHLSEDELWGVVAFMQVLPTLSPEHYARIAATARVLQVEETVVPGERRGVLVFNARDAARGRLALSQYACHSCHIIPGVTGPRLYVGPPLTEFGARLFIAGQLPNTADNLARFIRNPEGVHQHTAMPDMDVTSRDAADMAAYLLARP